MSSEVFLMPRRASVTVLLLHWAFHEKVKANHASDGYSIENRRKKTKETEFEFWGSGTNFSVFKTLGPTFISACLFHTPIMLRISGDISYFYFAWKIKQESGLTLTAMFFSLLPSAGKKLYWVKLCCSHQLWYLHHDSATWMGSDAPSCNFQHKVVSGQWLVDFLLVFSEEESATYHSPEHVQSALINQHLIFIFYYMLLTNIKLPGNPQSFIKPAMIQLTTRWQHLWNHYRVVIKNTF